MKLSFSTKVALFMILASQTLMVLGWVLPFMTIRANATMLFFDTEVLDETRSILGTISDLYRNGYTLPASLLTLFGIVVPNIKVSGYVYQLFVKKPSSALVWLFRFLNKWAMADVFAVSILIAFLVAGSFSGKDIRFQAELHNGFYFFAAYVILGGIAGWSVDLARPSDKA